MIFDTLKYIQEGLEKYLKELSQATPTTNLVRLDNIGMAEELGGTIDDMNQQVILSLVNLQEEVSLKNVPHYQIQNGRTRYKNPPVFLNLFLLFSVLDTDNYDAAIRRLSQVIEYFQWRKEFSYERTPTMQTLNQEVKVFMDLYTLTFEQLNHLWGALGGKQVPFVLYKVRVLAVKADRPDLEGGPISEIYINENP